MSWWHTEAPAMPSTEKAAATATTHMRPRILVVDDNEMNRDLLARRLSKRGFEVVAAADARAALAAAGDRRPDLILMDMRLPDMDGRDATRALRANGPTRTIPVIALTAHATDADREAALGAGCDDFETKPVDLDRLLQKIRALLDRA
jgi:CheY-like chemotaxis protein